jgi:hypothetical protein
MPNSNDFLNNLRVASPCHMGWDQMPGDDRVRFCDSCQFNVYNFSEMTAQEVERLIHETEGRICGRIYRRADGTVITRDCPVGLRAVRMRVAKFAGAVFATLLTACSITYPQTKEQSRQTPGYKVSLIAKDPEGAAVFSGTVMDAEGAVIPGAQVSLLSGQNITEKISVTDDSGQFLFKGMSDGEYTLSITATGFINFVVTSIRINASERYVTEIYMKAATETVGLIGREDPLQSTEVPMIQDPNLLQMRQITELPIIRGSVPILGRILFPIKSEEGNKDPRVKKHKP